MWNILWNCMAVVGIATIVLSVVLFLAFFLTSQADYKKKTRLNSYLNRKDDAE